MSGPHSLRAHQPAPPAHGPEDSAGADGAGEPCALAVAAPPAAVDLDLLTAGGRMTAAGRGDDPRDHLLCVDGDRSWTVELPAAGELIVGRSPQAAIVLEDKLVSRAHLRLEIGPAELVACDLGSRHGTRVNGEPLGRARPVHSGDVLAVGGAVMVVRRTPRHMSGALDHGAFLARLAEELTRAAGRDRELAVAVLRRGDRAAPDRAGAEAWLADHLAVTEHRAFLDERHLAVILPELELEEAQARILALVAATQLAAGIAVAPYDATSPDVLLSTARVAAERASAATVVGAAELTERVALGPQTAIVADPGMSQVYALARRLARTGMPVSIHGETGAGKELIALALHHHSERAAGPFVAINCAAIPEHLAEAELFGHARGAFTGAAGARAGQLEAASGGTLFLDEIAELSPSTQARLLRALEAGEVRRLGENATRSVDVRVVCASLRDLREEVASGRFRQDLYYRLGTARIELPPLRARPRDLAELARAFVAAACARLGRRPLAVAPATAWTIAARRWAGNVRELRHTLDFAVATAPDDARTLAPWHLPAEAALVAVAPDPTVMVTSLGPPPPARVTAATPFRPIAEELEALERRRMVEALRACAGVQVRAAELIAMPMRTFATKLRRYAIELADWEDAP